MQRIRFLQLGGFLKLFATLTTRIRKMPVRLAVLVVVPVLTIQTNNLLADAPAFATPLAVLHAIYTSPAPNFRAFHDTSQRPRFYSAHIHKAALRKEACYRKTWGMNELDFDFIIPGQDYKIERFDIIVLSRQEDAATASVRFENFGQDYDMRYRLRREGGQWLVDDVSYDGQTLSAALSAPCNKP